MAFRAPDPQIVKLREDVLGLLNQQAELTAQIKALTTVRGTAEEQKRLEKEVERLKLEKERIQEQHAREERETQHNVGLLRKQLDADRKNMERESKLSEQAAELRVREENLAADKARFTEEMTFQREHFERMAGDIKDILGKVLDRLPDVTASFTREEKTGPAKATARRAPARRDAEK